MKKQLLFTLLFLSWISGLFLICLFPPIPDYQVEGKSSGSISQDVLPELNQRNISLAGISQIEMGIEFLELVSRSGCNQEMKPFFRLKKEGFLIQTPFFFNTRLLFKAFFETW